MEMLHRMALLRAHHAATWEACDATDFCNPDNYGETLPGVSIAFVGDAIVYLRNGAIIGRYFGGRFERPQ